MTMRCCVIGGTGFLGSSLIPSLLRSGREVVVIGRSAVPIRTLPPSVTYISMGIEDRLQLRSVLADVDELIDLSYATVPQTSYTDPIFDIRSNLPPSIGLLEEVRNTNIRRFIVVSSGGTVYGPAYSIPIKEDSPTNPISPYGITKLTIEKYSLMFFRLYAVPVIVVRPSNAYGVGQKLFSGQGFIATALAAILEDREVPVFGEQGTIRDYIHVKDVAKGILGALEFAQVGEIYNIGSGIGRNNFDVLNTIAEICTQYGKKVRVKPLPSRGFDVLSNVLDSGKLTSCSGWIPRVDFKEGVLEVWKMMENAKRYD